MECSDLWLSNFPVTKKSRLELEESETTDEEDEWDDAFFIADDDDDSRYF